MAKIPDLIEFMKKQGMSSIAPEHIGPYFGNMTAELCTAFTSEAGKVWHCTVAEKEALLLPFDFLVWEKIPAQVDTIGLVFHFWLKSDYDAMEAANRWYISARKPNQWLQNATEALALS